MSRDARLIREYLGGSDAAFEALFDRHNQSLHAFAYHLTSDADDAEDLCQTAWVEAIRSLPSYEGRGTFRAWLHAVALNVHRGVLRKSRFETVSLQAEHVADPWMNSPEGTFERTESARRIRAALDDLDPVHREVLILHEIQGLKYREIAQILGCPLGTVKSRLHYAAAALRAAFDQTEVLEEATR